MSEKQKAKLQEELSDSDNEKDGDAKMNSSKNEKKVFENKNTVAKSKMDNKRQQKEALKKIKTKRQAGTTNTQPEKADSKM